MNFSDKLKEMSSGYSEEDVKGLFNPDHESITLNVKNPETLRKIPGVELPTKELTPTDVIRAGVAIVEGALKNVGVFLEDKEHGEEWSEMMILYLETLVSILFDCNCKIGRMEISEEDDDE